MKRHRNILLLFTRSLFSVAVFFVLVAGASWAAVDPITGAEPAEGFGGNATGGYGKPEVVVTTYAELASALGRGDVYIKVQGNLTASGSGIRTNRSNMTIDGEGAATIWGTATPTSRLQLLMEFTGKNIVVKNIRLRNSGDNLSFKKPAENILVSHVSTTGSYDDGMSPAYGSRNITIQYCAFFGCTRSCFIKYQEPQNISFHHNWIKGHYMRGPLVSTAYKVDVRNQLIEDWWSWGGPRFEIYATGNCINSTFILTGVTPGGTDNTCYVYQDGGPAYFSGNVFRGCRGRADNSSREIACAPVTTHPAAEAEAIVRASAGCLPRDAIDIAYITATRWPRLDESHPWIILPEQAGPVATITGPASPTHESPIIFTINFSKPVTGLTAAGILVTNAVKGELTGSGAGPYTLTTTPLGPGLVTCRINAGAAQDADGNGNPESNTLSILYEAPDIPEDLASWPNRLPLCFTGFTGSEPLTSFPLLVRLDAALFPPDDFEPNGADLRFTDAEGNPIPYEIETWNLDEMSSIWALVPQITSSTDYIWMLWGKPDVVSRERPARLWTNNFLGVWHLESNLQDSTAANNHATNQGATLEDAIVGTGAGFEGAQYIVLPAAAGSSEAGTLSVWIQNRTDYADLGHVFYLRGPGGTSTGAGNGLGGQNELHLNFQTSATLCFFIEGTQAGETPATYNDVIMNTDLSYADGEWRHIAATWQKPGMCHLYVDGELTVSAPHTGTIFPFSQFAALGKPETDNRYYIGLIDEARLSRVPRSEEWVRACYLNQRLDSTFIQYGSGLPMASVTGPPSPTPMSPIVFSIHFSKPVVGLSIAGFAVTNGHIESLIGDGAGPYTLEVTPFGPGLITCKVNADVAKDGDGNGNLESNVRSVLYQPVLPEDDFSSWAHEKVIRFVGFSGTDSLTSFPLLVRLNTAQFPPEEFEPGGADLRFMDAENTPLSYEIETWNQDGESSVWVVVPKIASDTDYIRMFWGRTGAASRARPVRVWDSDFLGVWHLANDLQDSTVAARHAVNNGTAPENGITGSGARFDGAQYIALSAGAGSSEIGSLSVWIKTSADFTNLAHVFYMRGPGGIGSTPGDGLGGQNELHLNFQTTETLRFFVEGTLVGQTPATLNDVIITTPDSYADGQWHHVAATWEKPGTCNLYVDGELKASAPHTGTIFPFTQFAALGKPEGNLRYYVGMMDEARLESAARSADWIRACYLNQKRDSIFLQYEEPPARARYWPSYGFRDLP